MKFTYYTIIGRDPAMLRAHLTNLKEVAGYDALQVDKELLVIVYRNPKIPKETTEEIIEVCERMGAIPFLYDEPDDDFLQNLYACWNAGYIFATGDVIFRAGSDQVFYTGSLQALVDVWTGYRWLPDPPIGHGGIVLQANTIENAKRSPESRHILADLGSTYQDFDQVGFNRLSEALIAKTDKKILTIEESLEVYGKPTGFHSSLGWIDRVDGCSWMMSRNAFLNHGPLPSLEGGITGDVIIHDRLQRARFKSFLVRDCITYHFVRGESQP